MVVLPVGSPGARQSSLQDDSVQASLFGDIFSFFELCLSLQVSHVEVQTAGHPSQQILEEIKKPGKYQTIHFRM